MRKCPYCAEEIQEEAQFCRFCQRELATGQVSGVQPIILQQRSWSPGVAAVLSLVIPGAGQIYKGQIMPGVVWLIFVVVGYFFFIVPGLFLHLFCIIAAAKDTPHLLTDSVGSSTTAPALSGESSHDDSSNASVTTKPYGTRALVWLVVAVVGLLLASLFGLGIFINSST